ncbi:protein kinase-like protein [Stackebrandtia albiflava]|uniref:non-specific serine/threonine protein kinase n=1 Tax=Stackebrandtia albiflava TaxID=406432 RepID=A0A562V4U6_9ACTN|nr:RIO1 family regulatory kinase/ATPase [Stackebrandtia albiflava]TWJ12865.1 protein kinase-like protein [Stackebrandtia albiflava]
MNDTIRAASPPPGHVSGAGSQAGDSVGGHRIVNAVRLRGCAAIYRATAPDGSPVALKTQCVAAPKRLRLRMDNEIAAHRRLAGIAPVATLVDTGTDGDQRFVAAEWRPGVPLRRMAEHTGISPRVESAEAAALLPVLAVAVSEAVARLHTADVAHGDLSRFNVLAAVDDRVSLIDLESALVVSDPDPLPVRRKVTWSYAPPEFADRVRPSKAADQYSLAAVLFRQLTGRRHRIPVPGAAPDSAQALGARVRVVAGWHARRWPGLLRVFARALATDPSERYGDVAEFTEALRHAFV